MNTTKLFHIVFFTFLITSCGFKDAEEKASNKVNKLLKERIVAGGLFPESAYSQSFWESNPKENWEKFTAFMNSSHGKLKSYDIIDVQTQGKKKGLSSAGWVGFQMNTEYENGVKGKEIISFYRDGKDQPLEIFRHIIDSSFLQEVREQQQSSQ